MTAPLWEHTDDGTVTSGARMIATLMDALRNRCHVMMTPPDGVHGYEVSLSPVENGMYYGTHASDPMAALLLALTNYEARTPEHEWPCEHANGGAGACEDSNCPAYRAEASR